ncbi:MAG: DUF4139 domain-containing protein [Thermodesulfovibrionales bacterium]
MFRQIARYAGLLSSLALLFVVSAFHEKALAAEATLSSGLNDQSGLSLTIYNVNLGLVKDQRTVKLPRGSSELRFMDVASQIIPASVHIKSLVEDRSLQVIEQNYEYDLMNPQKLLDKYVGRDVRLYFKNLYTEREETVTARLLSNNGGPIYRIGDEITFGHPGRVIFPEVPGNLISKPTLVWLLENSLPSPQNIEASYLTNGINWRSDYVVTLNSRDDMIDLSGWVTIDNKCGATYKNARLKLVAGDVNRVREERDYRGTLRMAKAEAVPAAPQFKEEEFFEYHIYTLQRPSTIKDNQIKQISLITASAVPVRKELVYKGTGYYYTSRYSDPIANLKVGVFIEIWNKKDHNLGIPLPKGTVRVYKHDNEGSLQFTGEDTIDHTAKDEKIRVKLGNAFDVAGTTRQLDWKKLASDTYESGYEITLRNHKKEDITVKIIEPVPGDWTILSSSHPYKKSSAFFAEFEVMVPKDGESKLTYKVRTRY